MSPTRPTRPASHVRAAGVTVRAPDGAALLDGINLSLTAGELCVIAGRNGAGKTLLARCLAGIIKPDKGRVIAEGSRPALVFQDTRSQILGQTVAEDVSLGPRSAGLPAHAIDRRVADALARTGLEELSRRDPLTLSGGEQRRLSVAALLALDPGILILDEPFASLDYEGVREVLSVVLELRARDVGVTVITHDLEKVLAHADRLVLLNGGRLRADDTPAAVIPGARSCGLRPPRGPVEEMTWLD